MRAEFYDDDNDKIYDLPDICLIEQSENGIIYHMCNEYNIRKATYVLKNRKLSKVGDINFAICEINEVIIK